MHNACCSSCKNEKLRTKIISRCIASHNFFPFVSILLLFWVNSCMTCYNKRDYWKTTLKKASWTCPGLLNRESTSLALVNSNFFTQWASQKFFNNIACNFSIRIQSPLHVVTIMKLIFIFPSTIVYLCLNDTDLIKRRKFHLILWLSMDTMMWNKCTLIFHVLPTNFIRFPCCLRH